MTAREHGYKTQKSDALYVELFYGHMLSTYQLAALLDRDPASIRESCLKLQKKGMIAQPPFQFTHPNFHPETYQPLRACYDPHYKRPAKPKPHDQQYCTTQNLFGIYALTTSSNKYICEEKGLKGKSRRLNWNNKRRKDYYELPHTLGITDFLLYMQKAVADEPGLAMTWQKDLTPHYVVKLRNIYLAFAGHSDNFNYEPDSFFAIEHINANPIYFLLEYDRNSEDYWISHRVGKSAKSFYKATLQKKVLLQDALTRRKLHQKELGIPHFVRLYVALTPGRAKKMVKMIEETSKKYPHFYYVSDVVTLKQKSPLDKVWRVPFQTELKPLPVNPKHL